MMRKKPLALVTGATSGIGEAIALQLARADIDVIALGRSEIKLEELQKVDGVNAFAVDITDTKAIAALLRNKEIDILINNAGTIPPIVNFAEMDQSDIDKTLSVNLNAAIATTLLVLPDMIAQKQGHIFFTGSTAGHAPFPNMAVYGASKAAISSFAASLRCDISGFGIRVTEIVAGRVETSLYSDVLADAARDDMYSAFDAVQPEDVARMLLSVLQMPAHVDVTRFDILPTAQFVGGGGFARKGK